MGRRIRINSYIAGRATKEIQAQVFEMDVSGNIVEEANSDLYILGQSGDILTDETVAVDTFIYNAGYFIRDYSVNNPDVVPNGYDLQVLATDSDVLDSVQFGDFSFHLTKPTKRGTKYALTTGGIYDDYYLEPHEVVTYMPGTEIGEVDIICRNSDINITDEVFVYGFPSSGKLVLYVKDLVDKEVYAYDSSSDDNSLSFSYLMEQNLNYGTTFASESHAYGDTVSGTTFLYVKGLSGEDFENNIYSPDADENNTYKIYVNPFHLKNMYDYDWQTRIDHDTEKLMGIRNYKRSGKTQDTIWLSYNYYALPEEVVQKYEMVERIRGLYKFKQNDGHKSNIYSIRITNSGLNEGMADGTAKTSLRNIIEEAVKSAVEKISPKHTQLWKIIWEGL